MTMERQIPDLLTGITNQLSELADTARRAHARTQVMETLLLNIVTKMQADSLLEPPLRTAVNITRDQVLASARARPSEGRPHIDHMKLDVLNDVLDAAGLMEPPTGG